MSRLVLTRKVKQTITIGDDIRVTVTQIPSRSIVHLAVDAPENVPVHRLEIYEKIQAEKQQPQ